MTALREQGVERIDTVTGDTMDELAQRGLTEVSFSADSRFVVGVTNDRLVLWRNSPGASDRPARYDGWDGTMPLHLPLPPQDKPYSVRVDAAAGAIRYLGAGGRTVRTVNARDVLGAPRDGVKHPPSLLSPTGRVRAVPRSRGGEVSYELRDAGSGRLLGTTPRVGHVPGRTPGSVAAFSPGGRFFAFTPVPLPVDDDGTARGTANPRVAVWDVDARRPAADVPLRRGQEPPGAPAVANARGVPVVYGVLSPEAWDLTRSRRITPFREGGVATRMALRPLLPLLALNDGTVLDLGTGRLLRDHTERDIGEAMAYSGVGDVLAVADGSGRILLYDGAMKSPRGVLVAGEPEGPDGSPVAVTALAFSPDGRTLAAGTRAGGVRLWDVPTRTAIGSPLPTSGDHVRSLAFSADGRSLHVQGSSTRPRTQSLDPERLADDLCTRFGALTRDEWASYIPDVGYRDIC
ncbi:WD40 repeat domain-containing protein [Streptomyces sp. NPDC093089]|uniref:WD40 repeat domain-containing protein n=1 Tax=Streptomyces sp. NPDC093089 TaxID=3366024 RepID=UPI0038096DFC